MGEDLMGQSFLPEGTMPLMHQVGGHVLGRSNGFKRTNIGFLQNDKGNIFKPVQGPTKGQREVEFYKSIFSNECNEPELIALKSFVPKFEGIFLTEEFPNAYIRLEDLTAKFQYPCVMDVKIGPVTYDMHADAAKIHREKTKFPDLHKVGFQLVGSKVYDPKSKTYTVHDRTYFRALNEHSILTQGLRPFFNCDEKASCHLINSFLKRLKNIERWFLSQKKYAFIASSLLFVYDGFVFVENSQGLIAHMSDLDDQYLHDSRLNICCDDESHIISSLLPSTTLSPMSSKLENQAEELFYDSITDLRMIDFTHVFSKTYKSLDENYLIGLQSVIKYLQQLFHECDSTS